MVSTLPKYRLLKLPKRVPSFMKRTSFVLPWGWICMAHETYENELDRALTLAHELEHLRSMGPGVLSRVLWYTQYYADFLFLLGLVLVGVQMQSALPAFGLLLIPGLSKFRLVEEVKAEAAKLDKANEYTPGIHAQKYRAALYKLTAFRYPYFITSPDRNQVPLYLTFSGEDDENQEGEDSNV